MKESTQVSVWEPVVVCSRVSVTGKLVETSPSRGDAAHGRVRNVVGSDARL